MRYWRVWLGGIVAVALCAVIAKQGRTVAGLRTENIKLHQSLTALEDTQARNLALESENRRLWESEEAATAELVRLRGQLKTLQTTNEPANLTALRFALAEVRRLQEENDTLKAESQPRMPRLGAWLGMSASDFTNGGIALDSVGVPSGVDLGVRINSLVEDGPAVRSGLQEGDVIVLFNGLPVIDLECLKTMLASARGGDLIPLDVVRSGKHLRIEATGQDWPQ